MGSGCNSGLGAQRFRCLRDCPGQVFCMFGICGLGPRFKVSGLSAKQVFDLGSEVMGKRCRRVTRLEPRLGVQVEVQFWRVQAQNPKP